MNPDRPQRILDAHVHQWDPRTTPRASSSLVKLLGWSPSLLRAAARRLTPASAVDFVGKLDYVASAYTGAELRADFGGHAVEAVVHVEAGWREEGLLGPVGETRWLEGLAAAGASPIAAIVAEADLSLGADLDALLRAHRDASPRLRGIRHKLAFSEDPAVLSWVRSPRLMREPEWRRGYAALAEHGLSFDAWLYHTQLDDLIEVVEAHPEVPVVLNHLATPIGIGGPFGSFGRDAGARAEIEASWREKLARLARSPQVFAKLSGLLMPVCGWGFHTRPQPPSRSEVVEKIGPLVRHAIDVFGVERCMFASNFPMDKVSIGYADLFDVFAAIVADLDAASREALFHGNAARFYRIA